MSVKQEQVSLPLGSAGIVGMTADMKLDGFEIQPKHLIIATALFVLLVKAAGMLSTVQ
jgi:preprotein translocase subunit Sec61beta